MDLRDQLDALNLNAFEHIEAVATLKDVFDHSIKPIASRAWLPSYTCLVYALRFAGDATYSAAIKRAGDDQLFAGKDFFDWLIFNQVLVQIIDGSESAGDFVVYFDVNQAFTHIGVLSDERRIKSKWGGLGLYEHALFEVPAKYGNDVKYFRPIKYDRAMTAFKQYLAEAC